jgi:hypothetical protein
VCDHEKSGDTAGTYPLKPEKNRVTHKIQSMQKLQLHYSAKMLFLHNCPLAERAEAHDLFFSNEVFFSH